MFVPGFSRRKMYGIILCVIFGAFAAVYGKVSIISPPMTLHEIKGGSVVFECVAEGINTRNDLSMQWVRKEDPARNIKMRLISVDNLQVYRSNRYSVIPKTGLPPGQKGYDLEISQLTVDDEGQYTCSVQGVGVTESQKYTLTVMIPPKLEFSDKDLLPKTIKLGESLTLTCKASGRPTPTISWRKLGSNLGNHTKVSGDSLIFTKVKKTDFGEYECKAENGAGRPATEVLDVKVHYAPDVDVKEAIVYSGPQKKAILTCLVSASPLAVIQWEFAGNLVDQRRRNVKQNFQELGVGIGREVQLVISNVNAQDFGIYKCIAKNDYGTDEQTIELTGLPQKVVITSNKKGPYAEQYKLTWEVISHDLPLDYTLMFRVLNGTEPGKWHNSSIPANADLNAENHKAIYTFKQLEPNTRYQAKVQARNSLGVGEVSDLFEFVTAEVVRPGAGLAGQTPAPPTTAPKSTMKDSAKTGQANKVSDGQYGSASSSLPSHTVTIICLLLSLRYIRL